MVARSGMAAVLVMGLMASAGGAAPDPQAQAGHDPDFRKCKKCGPALGKALSYLKANYKNPQTKRVIGSMAGGYMMGGFAFMMEGGSPKELEDAVKYFCQAIKDTGFNRNWYLSMGLFFLAEYATRYGLTAEIERALAEALKMAAQQQEATGGWCHHLQMWQEKGYNKMGGGRDLGMVTTMIYGAFLEFRALGVEINPAMMEKARANLEAISDGAGIRYGTDNMVGDAGMARASYVLLGLQASGRTADPWAAKFTKGIEQRYKSVPKGVHGFAPLHWFSVAAAMHRMGPEWYRMYGDEYLDKLIATQMPEGIVPLDGEDDVASTAVFACIVMMQKDGIFLPSKAKAGRAAAKSGKEELKAAADLLARGELGRAYQRLEMVALDREPAETVALVREKMKGIADMAWKRLGEAQVLESIDEKADALKAYQDLLKEFPTLPAATEARARIDALRAKK